DVAVSAGAIVALGDLSGAEAAEQLDVTGLAVCPGFIDMHGHSDATLLVDRRGPSKIHQGVTTEVVGNCGFSPAPLDDGSVEAIRAQHGVFCSAVPKLAWDWRRYGDY